MTRKAKVPHDAPKAYRSPLRAHRDEIRAWRLSGLTWQQVANRLEERHGIKRSLQAIQQFFRRTARRPLCALGMEHDPSGFEALPRPSNNKAEPPKPPTQTGGGAGAPEGADLTAEQPQMIRLKLWQPVPQQLP